MQFFFKVSVHFHNRQKRANSKFFLAHHQPYEPCKRLVAAPGVVRGTENNVVLKELNELSENLSFNSEFVLVFEIRSFKFFFFFFF